MSVENDLKALVDYSGAASLSGEQIMTAMRSLQPEEDRGMILYSADIATAPPDIASNPRYSKYICLDGTTKKLHYYDSGTSSWKPVTLGSVALSGIADFLITLIKLDKTGAGTTKAIGFDGTQAQWLNVVDIIANASLALSKLPVAGSSGSFLRTVGGVNVWDSLANATADILAGLTSFDINKLSGKVASGLLYTDASNVAAWASWATFFDSILTNKAIKLTKIDNNGAAVNQGLLWDGTVWKPSDVSKKPIASSTFAFPADAAAASATAIRLVHTLSAPPAFMRWVAVCTTIDNGWQPYDEVAIEQFCVNAAGYYPAFYPYADNSYCGLSYNNAAAGRLIATKGGGVGATVVPGSWLIKCYWI